MHVTGPSALIPVASISSPKVQRILSRINRAGKFTDGMTSLPRIDKVNNNEFDESLDPVRYQIVSAMDRAVNRAQIPISLIGDTKLQDILKTVDEASPHPDQSASLAKLHAYAASHPTQISTADRSILDQTIRVAVSSNLQTTPVPFSEAVSTIFQTSVFATGGRLDFPEILGDQPAKDYVQDSGAFAHFVAATVLDWNTQFGQNSSSLQRAIQPFVDADDGQNPNSISDWTQRAQRNGLIFSTRMGDQPSIDVYKAALQIHQTLPLGVLLECVAKELICLPDPATRATTEDRLSHQEDITHSLGEALDSLLFPEGLGKPPVKLTDLDPVAQISAELAYAPDAKTFKEAKALAQNLADAITELVHPETPIALK